MWFAVACLIVAVTTWFTFNNMEDQYNSVGPQRPSTPDRLFASLPITRILIFIGRRIKAGSHAILPSISPRPRKTTPCQRKSGAVAAEWIHEYAGKRARRKIAIPCPLQPERTAVLARNRRLAASKYATAWRNLLPKIYRPALRRDRSNAPGQQRGCTDRRPSELRQRGPGSLAPWRVRPKEARHAGQRDFGGIG